MRVKMRIDPTATRREKLCIIPSITKLTKLPQGPERPAAGGIERLDVGSACLEMARVCRDDDPTLYLDMHLS